jgi:hypothetical protein
MFSHNLGPLCVLKGESAIAGPAAGPGAICIPGFPRGAEVAARRVARRGVLRLYGFTV